MSKAKPDILPTINQESGEITTAAKQSLVTPDHFTDIAAIQPIDSPMEEEKKGADNFLMQFFKSNTTRHPLECLMPKKSLDASKCKPDTKITIITTVDMETEKEHCFQPLMPGFSIKEFKRQIKQAHKLEESTKFHFCNKQTRQRIDFSNQMNPSELFGYHECQFVLALLNERYQANTLIGKDLTKIKSATGAKEQPINLEREVKLDPFWTIAQKEDAVKMMLRTQFPDIVKDKIGGQKYKCFFIKCRKTFEHLKPLFEHQKIHLKNHRPFACPYEGCSKSFMSKGHLRNHSETHQTQKNFVCPVAGCNESYSRQQRLKVHLKKHNGMRDYVCPFENCRKAFYEKGNLKTHLRLHTGEKPYHCTAKDCDKSFATQGHLNDHFFKTHQNAEQQHESQNAKYLAQETQIKKTPAEADSESEGKFSNDANMSSSFVDQTMHTGFQMQLYNQINLNDINQSHEASGKMIMRLNQHNTEKLAQNDALYSHAEANTLIIKQSLGIPVENELDLESKPGLAGQKPSMQIMGGKRKKLLKINITAANDVAIEVNEYNQQINSVPKPIDMQSVSMRRDLESKSMLHDQMSACSAGKMEIATDYMPNFFSFKDYQHQTSKNRGTKTCIKTQNRTLNPPTPIKANPEVHLDTQSLSLSQSGKSKQKQELPEVPPTTLKQAFGVKTLKTNNEFIMPAQTPLNPKQLAKRRFFNSNQPGPQFESVDSQDVSGEDAPRKRDTKADEKMENQFNETMRWGIHLQRLKSVQEVESSQQAMNVSQPQKSITQSSVPTFAAKEKGQGSYYTMGGPNINLQSMSQTSNANDMKDIGSIEGGNEHFKAQILDKRSNIGSKELLEQLNDSQKISTLQWKKQSSELLPYQKDADQFKVPSQKANETSNLLPLKDLNVIQNYERGNESMESQPKEKDSLPVFNHNQNPLANRSTLLSQLGYMQATATTVKKDTAVGNSFFGQAQIPIPFSCQKLPERNEIAFFQTLVPNSESKQTPQICNKGSSLNLNTNFEKSQNSAYPLQNLDQQSKNNFQQSMQIDCSVMSNMQLTPMQSQNASQTNKSFHLQRIQVPVLASPLVSGTSIAQAQHNFRNPQVMNNHSQSENKSGEYAAGPQKISSSLTDNTPSSIRWDKSQFSVSPISHNLSNPSMFFSQNQFANTQKTPQQLQQQIQMIHQQFQQKQQSQQPAVNSQSVQSPLSNQQVSKISRPSDHHLKQTGVQTNMTVNNQFDSILVQVDAQQLIYAQQHPPIAGMKQTLTNPRNIGNGDQSCQNLSRTVVVDENNGSNQVAEAQTMGKSILQNNSSQNLYQVGPQKMQAMLRPNPHQITTPDEIIQTDKPGNGLKRGATEEQEIMSSAQVNNNKFDSGGRQQVQQSPILSNQERLTTSQFKKDSSSQPSSMKNPQIELMKRKIRYQQKLQKIEYQLQMISQSQNQLSMQQAMLKQQHQSNMSQGNFFFAQPIVPSEILIHRQQSPNINVGMMQQISPWINPWQQTRQQMMQMQMEKNMFEMNNQYGLMPQPIMFDQQSGFYCQSSPAIKNQFNGFVGMNGFNPSSSSGLSSSVDTNLLQQQQFFSEQQFMQQQMADQQQIYGNAMMLGGTPNRYTRHTFDNNQPFGSVQRPSSLSNSTPGRQGYTVFTQQISDPNSTAVFQQNPQSNNQTVASFQQMNNIQQNDQNASLDILMQNTRTPVSCKTPPLMKLSNEPNSTLNSQYHPSQLTQLGPQ